MAAEVDAFKLFASFMRNGSAEDRVKAAKGIHIVAQQIGKDRTNSELLPFLADFTEEHDEILLAFASNLRNCLRPAGGPENASQIFMILHKLCETEETVVRDGAVDSLNALVEDIEPGQVDKMFFPIITQLSSAAWFTGRVSACGLLASAYARSESDTVKDQIMSHFARLCKDETPMVRRAAAHALPGMFKSLAASGAGESVLKSFLTLSTDDTDSVRIIAVKACTEAANSLPPRQVIDNICPLVKRWVEDKSWRIRKAVASVLYPVCVRIGREDTVHRSMLTLFSALLTDPEREVKTVACSDLSNLCDFVGAEAFTPALLVQLKALLEDESPNVRTAATEACLGLLPKLNLVEQVVGMLKDQVPEIRRNVIANGVAKISEKLTGDQFSENVLTHLKKCVEDKQWLVRAAFIEQIPTITKKMGFKYFKDNLLDMYVTLCADKFAAVQKSAVGVVDQIAPDSNFVASQLVPRLLKMYGTSTLFKNRVIVLRFAKKIASTDKAAFTKLVPFIQECLEHSVPNIQLLACDAIVAAKDMLAKEVAVKTFRAKVLPLLDNPDPDVKESAVATVTAYDWTTEDDSDPAAAEAAVSAASKVDVE